MGEPAKLLRLSSTFCYNSHQSFNLLRAVGQAHPSLLRLEVRIIAGGGGTKRSTHQSDRRIFLSFLVAAEATLLVHESILNEKLSERRTAKDIR